MGMHFAVLIYALLTTVSVAILFLAATRQPRVEPLQPDERLLRVPARFFADDRLPTARDVVPVEVLLLQIERHIHLELAAAEAFCNAPTSEGLRTPTVSALQH